MYIKTDWREKGVTLAELMIAMILTLLLASAVYSIYASTTRSMSDSYNRNQDRETTSIASRLIQKDLREILKSTDLDSISYADKSNLTFYADIDHDNLPEKIAYSVSDETMTRNLYEPVNTEAPFNFSTIPTAMALAEHVTSNQIFSYRADYNTEMTAFPVSEPDRKLIRIIEVDLSVDSTGVDAPPTATNVFFDVYLRNLDVQIN